MARREKLFLGSSLLHSFGDYLWCRMCLFPLGKNGIILGTIFVVLLKWFFDGFGFRLGYQNTPTMRPKKGIKTNIWKSLILLAFITLWLIQGCWESSFFNVFFRNPILGCLLELILLFLAHFWNPFWRQFLSLLGTIFASIFRPPKNIPKVREPREPPKQNSARSPPPQTPPP